MLDKMLKMRNKKGFTLMEMLIVVAIIAILIAIAIPTFNSSMEKARKGTDEANVRSLYGAITTEVMTNDKACKTITVAGSTTVDLSATITFDDNSTITVTPGAAVKMQSAKSVADGGLNAATNAPYVTYTYDNTLVATFGVATAAASNGGQENPA